MVSPPAATVGFHDDHRDKLTITSRLPIEVNSRALFWLITIASTYFNGNDQQVTEYSALLRCRDCNFGYNAGNSFVTVQNLVRIGQYAEDHATKCPRTGRTFDLLDPNIA